MSKSKLTLWLALVAILASPIPALANGAGAGITGSPHDFSAETWNGRKELCRVCHVPHDHNKNQDLFMNGLLWNHEMSAASYTMYAEWQTVPGFTSFIDGAYEFEPIGVAKMCLGCHDGTVAIDSFDKWVGAPTEGKFISDWDAGFQVPGPGITSVFAGQKNLVGSHPYSITYDETADPGLRPKSTLMFDGVNTIADVLDVGRVACSSCHDVHDSVGESVPGTHLLRVPQTIAQGGVPSGLCLTCHKK